MSSKKVVEHVFKLLEGLENRPLKTYPKSSMTFVGGIQKCCVDTNDPVSVVFMLCGYRAIARSITLSS